MQGVRGYRKSAIEQCECIAKGRSLFGQSDLGFFGPIQLERSVGEG
jgi:hypothetical protein